VRDAGIIAVVGLRRYGKSTHVVRLANASDRVIFYDTLNDDYSEGVVCRDWVAFEKLWLASYRGRFRITYKPQNPMEHFGEFCEMAFACANCTVVIDEIQLYFRGACCCPELTKLITAGGHAEVTVIGVTQMPKRLGEVLRSQAHEWHIFALREDTHLKYVAERCPGVDPALIKSLPKYEYLHFVDGAEFYERCRDDLNSEHIDCRRLEYEGSGTTSGSDADPGKHDDSLGSLECQSADRSASLPDSQD